MAVAPLGVTLDPLPCASRHWPFSALTMGDSIAAEADWAASRAATSAADGQAATAAWCGVGETVVRRGGLAEAGVGQDGRRTPAAPTQAPQ